MHKLHSLLIGFLSLAVAIIHGVQGATMVTGSVFCDQCKDGQVSLFDYPISGMKVQMMCPSGSEMVKMAEEVTNMLGNYVMNIDGTPDLSKCYAQISGTADKSSSNSCHASTGTPKNVTLMFSMFDMANFYVDPLVSQPDKPASFCPKSPSPPEASTPTSPPVVPVSPVPPSTPSPPAFALPPMPKIPSLPPMPPLPFLEVTACPYQNWTMPEYRCYWRAVNPDTAVADVFGQRAEKTYGKDMTLWTGLKGRGDPHRTLLREATAAFLNSFNSLRFTYNAFQVVHRFDSALAANSTREVLVTALKFKRANAGTGPSSCKFTHCK